MGVRLDQEDASCTGGQENVRLVAAIPTNVKDGVYPMLHEEPLVKLFFAPSCSFISCRDSWCPQCPPGIFDLSAPDMPPEKLAACQFF
jgi:hypothetical protein